ncbi:MAG TPA: 6-phosphofructokinase [Candidatus Jacksonbacteria bacterium]|nr:MAG: Diphosphate-fructose-6-phosphate 1-phosphotransferase [Parcubacteria group bacterium GW2011_GWA2_42_28]HBH46320.1 6-phosphofructokinase [Candidatus Jacksonbacteria bacterium]HCC49427.1 6-phosphofructokinase [Candidatus Jacksonbacteria bacterium]
MILTFVPLLVCGRGHCEVRENPANKVGIWVGGGPAPGIDGAIRATALQALNSGHEVVGIPNGLENLVNGKISLCRQLLAQDVADIHLYGGSILGTSRANLLQKDVESDKMIPSQGKIDNVIIALSKLGISILISIGGDDTALSQKLIADAAKQKGLNIICVHIPKTIDNDLPLEQNTPTFGFQTAVDFAYEICKNYRKDAQTTGRWFFVTVMGRTAGHLALALGSALGAEITLIPEEFKGKTIKLGHIYDILTTSIIKAMAQGQNYGIAVIAEGIAALIDDAQWETLANEGVKVEHDDAGHLRIAEIPLASILSRHVVKQLSEMGIKLTITPESVGYTLRTQDPNAFDSRYVSILGNAAMSFALFKESGLVYYRFSDDSIRLIPFDQIFDKTTGRTAVRLVNTNGASYIIAQETMTRIRFNENQESVAAMAREAKMTSTEFAGRFGYLIQ